MFYLRQYLSVDYFNSLMIALSNVSKHFGNTKAVDDISFEVREGENMILLGTSGCGKTTTLRIINRLTAPSSGKITVNGKDICEQSPEILRRHIGYVLQANGLFPHYTVAENISIVPELLKWDKNKIEERTRGLLEKLHLSSEFLDVYPEQLSGGQQQRVGLARALAAHPPVLLMDEPFGALDPLTRSTIRKEFSNLDEFKIKTIVMVTHDVQEAFEMGDRICIMDKGKIMQTGTPFELLFRPQNDFVKNFLAGHRLQLELNSIELHHLWNYLKNINSEVSNSSKTFSSSSTMWEALEELSGKRKSLIHITHQNETRQAGFTELMNAYQQYKSRLN